MSQSETTQKAPGVGPLSPEFLAAVAEGVGAALSGKVPGTPAVPVTPADLGAASGTATLPRAAPVIAKAGRIKSRKLWVTLHPGHTGRPDPLGLAASGPQVAVAALAAEYVAAQPGWTAPKRTAAPMRKRHLLSAWSWPWPWPPAPFCPTPPEALNAEQAGRMEWSTPPGQTEADVAVAKSVAPEQAAAIDAAVGDHLEELRNGVVLIREQLAEGRPGVADAIWRVVRPVVGAAAMKLLASVPPVRPDWPEVAP
jgi:hypothetical protein